jgi:hypothetical protein
MHEYIVARSARWALNLVEDGHLTMDQAYKLQFIERSPANGKEQ